MVDLPTKEEIEKRMIAHLEQRGNSDIVHLLWKGYLAALMDWGIFKPNDYHDLNGLLKVIGEDERREIFLGVSNEQ